MSSVQVRERMQRAKEGAQNPHFFGYQKKKKRKKKKKTKGAKCGCAASKGLVQLWSLRMLK
jgi:hypothetical protein